MSKTIIVERSLPLFWPIFWLLVFWPIGAIWLLVRLSHNFKINRSYIPWGCFVLALLCYLAFSFSKHEFRLSPISWVVSYSVNHGLTKGNKSYFYQKTVTI